MVKLKNLLVYTFIAVAFNGCGGGGSSISVLPSDATFSQTDNTNIKIDILFVIDDSGSMAPVQTNLRNNFGNFINDFYDKGYDFRIAVAKTSAYNGGTGETGTTTVAFRCGHGNLCGAGSQSYGEACSSYPQHTTIGNGTPGLGTDHILSSLDMDKATMTTKFKRNADVGLCGSGDERAIESTESVLQAMATVYTGANQFPRPGSHFAVVHVGDEPDGKWSSSSSSNNTGSLSNHFLPGFSHSTAGNQAENEAVVQEFLSALEARAADGVSVHAIQNLIGTPTSGACDPASQIGHAQMYMADIADGLKIGICGNFAGPLALLGDHIASLASAFALSETLDPNGIDTLKVYVQTNPPDGVFAQVPRNSSNGFSFDQPSNSVIFHGSAVPPQGAVIGVTYTCSTLGCL